MIIMRTFIRSYLHTYIHTLCGLPHYEEVRSSHQSEMEVTDIIKLTIPKGKGSLMLLSLPTLKDASKANYLTMRRSGATHRFLRRR